MSNLEVFKPKSTEQLVQQTSDVSTILGEFVTQLSIHNETLGLVVGDLKERFPVRYKAYLDTLRRSRANEVPDYLYSRRIHTLNALDRYITTHYSQSEGDRTLFDPQMNAFEALRLSLEDDVIDGYIRLPTGSGKTVLFTEFVEAITPQTLIVVPTRILVGQTEEKFKQFAPSVETGKVYSDAKQYDRPVTITTYASFLRGVENGKINPADYDLLILDEAHKSLSPRRIAAVQRFTEAVKLGFTATPKYTDNKHLGNLLNTEIYRMSIREAVEDGLLTPLSVYLAKTDVNLSKVRVTSSGNYNNGDLERAVNIAVRNTAAVDLYKAMFLGQTAVAYCVSVKHAEDLANYFNKAGISAGVVSSHQKSSEQDNTLRKLKSGGLKVICNADILIEGFDDSRVSVCLNLRPTASPVVAEQRAGRVLRPDPNNPFKHAYIVDFIDKFGSPDHFPISFAQIVEASHVFRKDHTPDFRKGIGIGVIRYPEIEVSGLKVVTDAEEVMRIVQEMVDQKYEPAQEGWLTITALSNTYRVGPHTMKQLLDNYREVYPDDFKIFRSSQGRLYEYFSPIISAMIKDVKEKLQAPVEGWFSMSLLEAELNMSHPTIKRFMDKHRGDDPAYFRVFKKEAGQMVEYFSPELVALIRQQAKEGQVTADTPHQGWVTDREAALLLGVDRGTIRRFAAKYKENEPDLFGKFKKKAGRVGEYMSPKIIDELRATLERVPLAEEGWIRLSVVASVFGISVAVVRTVAERHRKNHPELFQTFRAVKGGGVSEHISPELSTTLKEEIAAFLIKPEEGWIDHRTIYQELNISHTTVDRRLQEYRKTYPQLFRYFLDIEREKSVLREYVGPEIVELLRNEIIGVEPIPTGWLSGSDIEQSFKISAGRVRHYVRRYRSSNPEYFKILVGKRHHITQYFAPELVEAIRSHSSSKPLS